MIKNNIFKWLPIFIIISATTLSAKSQATDYSPEKIIKSRIAEITEYEIYYSYPYESIYTDTIQGTRIDTFINCKLSFDTLGRIIQKKEKFNLKGISRVTTYYTYESISLNGKIIETKTIKRVDNNDEAIETSDILSSPEASVSQYSESGNITTLEEFEYHNVQTTKFIYNEKGLLQRKEIFYNDKPKEKFFIEYTIR